MAAIGTSRSNASSPVSLRSRVNRQSIDNPVLRASARRCVDDAEEDNVTVRQALASASHLRTAPPQASPPPRVWLLGVDSHAQANPLAQTLAHFAPEQDQALLSASAALSTSTSPNHSPRSSASTTSELETLRAKMALLEHLVASQQVTLTAAVQNMVEQHASLPATLAAAMATVKGPINRKPYDAFPNLAPYAGDGPPNRFLREFRTWNLLREAGPLEPGPLACQLLNKLTGKAAQWASRRFADGSPATVAAISEGLREVFGREYEGARVLLAIYRLRTNYNLGGKQRLLALEELHEQARDYFVPLNPGPAECEFCQLLDLFNRDSREYTNFLAELTANPECNEAALRRREELDMGAAEAAAGWGPSRASLLVPPSLEREALFKLRNVLGRASLLRLEPPTQAFPPPGSAGRQARACLTEGHQPPPSLTPSDLLPPLTPGDPPPQPPGFGAPTDSAEARCRVLQDRTRDLERSTKNPPHYYGDNSDPQRKAKNAKEFQLRKTNKHCFKCRLSDAKQIHFNECPLHGVKATLAGTASNAPSVPRPSA